ncbi:MAG: bifunctional cobalt-precorrin 5A hydrolase/precorrin-3B C(17)-methyltransferase, partial [Synergistaceae bacterium]|nr:bifunctional cobalt-precorrin 5A hydrolase/precorrin-3B C(17)-methyltransferase [Synergistaceae bacterium]
MLKKNRYVFHYERGAEVAKALVRALDAEMTPLSDGSAADAFSKRWNDASAFIFVGALAIAVRSVAPLMRDKATDPALVVVSEDGEVVIPVVAGHVGGASDLARTCADILSAYGAVFTPTTSSDRSGFVAPDLWAARRGWQVLLRTGMASVIRKLIGTGKILVWVDPLLAESGTKFPLPCGYDAAATQTDADIIISPGSIQKLVGAKPQIVPRVIVAGVGCRRGAACEVLERSLKRALSSNPKGPLLMESLCELRTAEVKSDEEGLLSLAELCGVPLVTVSDEEIKSQAGDFSPSAAERHVGLPGVAEQAAASGGVLLGPRQAEDGVTVALSVSNPARYGELFVVGTGPGDARFFTAEARTAISVSDVVVGYGLYVDLLPPAWIHGKIVERYGMGEEEERVRNALDHAASGYSVALVSGGDPALFGLAPLVLSMAPKDLPIRVLPGITAAQAAGRAVGAPYSNGLVLLSISDYLQPWDAVVRAMECAEASGLTVAIYNPVKRGLAEKLAEVRSIFSRRRLLIVRDAGREDEAVREIPVEELEENSLDMRSLMLFLSPVAREVPRLGGK